MTPSRYPDATAKDFLYRFSGGSLPTPRNIGSPKEPIFLYKINHPKYSDTTVTYRPAGSASYKTTNTTATIEINNKTIKNINLKSDDKYSSLPKELKLKFPIKAEVKL